MKRRQPALIFATCFFLLNGGLAVFYAYADLGDKSMHKWLRDHKPINTFLFMFCNIGYGFGMYILLIRQWIAAYQLPTLLGPGIQKKLKITEVEDEEASNASVLSTTDAEDKIRKSLRNQKYF